MEMCDCSREDAEKAMKMAGGNEDEAANIIFDGRLHDDEIAEAVRAAAEADPGAAARPLATPVGLEPVEGDLVVLPRPKCAPAGRDAST